tara:strand:- start:79 stop:357 length:279 start_codon:yes stop_codon:yes gene_type:complete
MSRKASGMCYVENVQKYKIMLKQEALDKIVELEQELHQEQNSTEYWNVEYNQLLELYDSLTNSDKNPILKRLEKSSIIQEQKILDFLDDLGL